MTADELLRLPSGSCRYELRRGVLKTMPPHGARHSEVSMEIGLSLGNHVHDRQLGKTYAGTGFWLERDPDTVLGADYAFVRKERVIRTQHFYPGPPDIAVEVISSFNDTDAEMADKIVEWLRGGTPVVIAADSRANTVKVHRPSGVIEVHDTLAVDDVLPGWQLPLSEIFA